MDFVERTVAEGVPVDERVAVFDNDGTLWCEKPMPIQLDFILRRLVAMAEAAARRCASGSRGRRRTSATTTGSATLMAEHYAGDDTNVQILAGGILAAYAGISVEDFEAQSDAFLRTRAAPDPWSRLPRVRLRADGRAARATSTANGFANYIASGGGRDFMRPDQPGGYGIPRDRVIGSSLDVRLHERRARRHDHPQGRGRLPRRRPAEADPHLEPHRPPAAARRRATRTATSRCSIHPARRQAVPAPARPARRRRARVRLHGRRRAGARKGPADGWTVASVKHDWARVF